MSHGTTILRLVIQGRWRRNFAADVPFAADYDSSAAVPRLDEHGWLIAQ